MMIIHSQWRVKVALSVVFFFAIQGVAGQSVSHDILQKKVTLKGRSIAFEEVLNQLSSQTKLYFIYSSNAIGLKTPISIEATRRPLNEVLQALSDIMHITFRKEGSYVVIKPVSTTSVVRQVKILSPVKKQSSLAVEPLEAEPPPSKVHSTSIGRPLSISPDLLAKNLLSCRSEFSRIDTSFVKQYFPLKITNRNARNIFFSSFGVIGNEYWAGAEVQIGKPWLYAVLHMGRLRGGSFRHGFGFGSSMPIKPRITLNPIYTFGTVKQQEDYLVDPDINLVIKDGLKAVGRHHQLKLVFEIKLTDKFRGHFGPSLNFLKTNYTVQSDGIVFTDDLKTSAVEYGVEQVRVNRIIYNPPLAAYSTIKTWCGFEAGVSYSLKFLSR